MIESILIACLAIVLSYIAKYKKYNYCLFLAFFIIVVFLSLGFEWGNDVATYEIYYNKYVDSGVSLWDVSSLKALNEKDEFGWVFLNILLKPIGFYGFRAVLFIIENIILFLFFKRKVNPKWYWLAMMIYTLNPNFMVLSSSMMRQWLAMCIVIYSFGFLEKKKPLMYLLFIGLCYTIHRSSFICAPLVFLPYVNLNFHKWNLIYIVPLLVIYFFFSQFLVSGLSDILKTEDIYSHYGTSLYNSGIGFVSILISILYIIMLINMNKIKKTDSIYISVLSLYLFILPLYSYSGLASRLTFYYTIFSIFAFPIFLSQKNLNETLKKIELYGILSYTLYNFIIFWSDPMWLMFFGIYNNIIDKGII